MDSSDIEAWTAPAFKEIVERDLRAQSTPEEAEYLRQAENLDRWKAQLQVIQHSLGLQIRELEERNQIDTTILKQVSDVEVRDTITSAFRSRSYQRRKINRFRQSVETSLAEVKFLQERQRGMAMDLRAQISALRGAIYRHKHNVVTKGDRTEFDHELWSILDTRDDAG